MWQASRTILTAKYSFPFDRCVVSFPPDETPPKSRIADCSRMILGRYGVTLGFDDNSLWIANDDSHAGRELSSLVNYVSYKTFICYNILMPSDEPEYPPAAADASQVVFHLAKIVEKQKRSNGKIAVWHEDEPCELVLAKQDIEDYLQAIDLPLVYAIYYYLMGCNTPMYFLVEFYKCLEVIEEQLGGEKDLLKNLTRFGLEPALHKTVKSLANDRSKPLSIGRHAPYPEVPMIPVDTKWLFDDPRGRKTFEDGEEACRSVIECYIRYRLDGFRDTRK
jgi:hypothetical protein